ncbi:MAG: DNA cytosine methyltransferase [Phycicoccus sp.]|nr:DNA cytosine methyltransferase [Phycicoccus sp.]
MSRQLTAIDLFAGAGGATQGLRDSGFRVLAAVENDRDAASTYRLNHPTVQLFEADIRSIKATRLREQLRLRPRELTLLKVCPPCQGFSSLAEGRAEVDNFRNDLVGHTIRFVRAFEPAAVLLENVPGLGRDVRSIRLQERLKALGYATRVYKVNALDFGVPQRRRRLIILALRGLRSSDRLPEQLREQGLDGPTSNPTVRTAFDCLAEAATEGDPLNVARSSTPTVKARIRAVPVGGTRFDLPPEHRLACHENLDLRGRNATASYGRLRLDEPAPTMTTRCTTPACGSFIHPTEHRGITLREAATLQTFPPTYRFSGAYGSVERQIGNAVPVLMAAVLGRTIKALVP